MRMKSLNQVWIVLLCCVMGLGLAGCGDSQTNNPVGSSRDLSVGNVRNSSSGLLSEDTEGSAIDSTSYPAGTIVIVAIGDSITYGQGSSQGGYPAILQRKLTSAGYNVVVRNRGIPGEHSASTFQRWLGEISTADISLLMIGTNDIVDPSSCSEWFNCRTREYIEAMLNQALISKKIPLVSTVTPAKSTGNRAEYNPNIRELNAKIFNVAARCGVTLVDNYQAIQQNGGDSLFSDNLHFNDSGYNAIAQYWYDALVGGGLMEQAGD